MIGELGIPHTVRAHRVPMYLQGALGQTVPDPSIVDVAPPDFSVAPIDVTSIIPVSNVMPEAQPLLALGYTTDEADLIIGAYNGGNLTDAQFQQILNGHLSADQVSSMVFGTMPTLPQGPLTPAEQTAATAAVARAQAAQKTPLSAAQVSSIMASAARSVTPTLAPGAAPRVGVPLPGTAAGSFLNQQAVAGIPNAFLIGGMLLLAVMMGGGGRR